jgi:hypothetical protein
MRNLRSRAARSTTLDLTAIDVKMHGAGPPVSLHFGEGVAGSPVRDMRRYRRALVGGAIGLLASASLAACTRTSDGATPGAREGTGAAVRDDMKALGKATEKAAKDIGQATSELADKAGAHGDDAWITAKVKGELTRRGFDPLHVHVDTTAKVVTLSGAVETAAQRQVAVDLAKAVTGVAGVEDHLFVGPARR